MDQRARRGEPPRELPAATPPHVVPVAMNLHRWERIAFLHWPFDPEVVARLVPDELDVLTFDGAAWVGITPFRITVRLPRVPLPYPRWVFPETNVRTYVGAADGRQGLWFLRMEVPALWFAVTLRALGLPYHWQRMTMSYEAGRCAYVSTDRVAPHAPSHAVAVRCGAALEPAWGGPRERFLTARWGAFHRRDPLLMYTRAEHPPWPLHAAHVEVCEVGPLLARAGLPRPQGPPLAHFSPGVRVRIGHPRLVGAPVPGTRRS